MANKLELVITPEVAKKAKGYFDTDSCLVCTLLKEKGYKNAGAGGSICHGETEKGDAIRFEICSDIQGMYTSLNDNGKVNKEAIGQKVILKRYDY